VRKGKRRNAKYEGRRGFLESVINLPQRTQGKAGEGYILGERVILFWGGFINAIVGDALPSPFCLQIMF
jgi:hypothetical protein